MTHPITHTRPKQIINTHPPPNPPPKHTGTTTTLSNFILHRDKPLAALSCAGLALIFGANATGVEWLPSALHESRLWNTLGCGMLIGSSYLAHRSEAGHDHSSHGHGHDGHGHKHAEEGKGAKAK